MSADPHSPERQGPPSFDGIRELDSTPPRAWIVIYAVTFLFSIWLFVAYPAIPWLTHGGTDGGTGLLGWTSRGAILRDDGAAAARPPGLQARFDAASYAEIEADRALRDYAIAAGRAAFGTNCAGCHGREGAGLPGFPNLRDAQWLWGGTAEAIERSIRVGIRWPGEEETRLSEMPAFGRLGVLDRAQVADLAHHVLGFSRAPHDAAAAARAAPLYAENCASCHGERGEGNQDVGAPNLTTGIWLNGGSHDAIRATIHAPRHGVMPAFGGRLDEATIRKLVVFVRGFGGGE